MVHLTVKAPSSIIIRPHRQLWSHNPKCPELEFQVNERKIGRTHLSVTRDENKGTIRWIRSPKSNKGFDSRCQLISSRARHFKNVPEPRHILSLVLGTFGKVRLQQMCWPSGPYERASEAAYSQNGVPFLSSFHPFCF